MNRILLSTTLLAALLSSAAAVAQPDHKDEPRGEAHGQAQPAGAPNRGGHEGQGGKDQGRQAQAPAREAAGPQPGARVERQDRAQPASPPREMSRQAPIARDRGAVAPHERANAERSRAAPAVEPRARSSREVGPSSSAQRGAVNAGARPGGQFVYRGKSHEVIRGPSFSYPSGWGYRRWGAGQSLPFLFLSQSYFFNDYDRYGFGPPPRDYVWVRYGPDLLLVDRRTGRIRDVIYGVFY